MHNQMQQSTQNSLKTVFKIQGIGLARVILGIPIEHIFDRFKILCQTDCSKNSLSKVIMSELSSSGVLQTVFAGFSSNLSLFPMMILVPKFINERMPTQSTQIFPTLHKTLSGIFIGAFESLITCPLERSKCLQMTGSNIKLLVQSPREMFIGLYSLMLRQSVSWVSYLYWDHKVRHSFKLNFEDSLSSTEIIFCAFLTSCLNVLTVQPFDTIKTLYQMNGSPFKGKKYSAAIRDLISNQGFGKIYSGWQIRISQLFTQAILTTPVIDYLERTYGKPENLSIS